MAQQHDAVRLESLKKSRPIQIPAAGQYDVDHVGAVEALPLHDERLGPDHLLGRNEVHALAENDVLGGVLEPAVVDHRDSISRAEDDIHVGPAPVNLAKPVRKCKLSGLTEAFE